MNWRIATTVSIFLALMLALPARAEFVAKADRHSTGNGAIVETATRPRAYIITKTLRTGQSYKWGGLSIAVRRVGKGRDAIDNYVSLIARTAGYSQNFTLRQYESEYIGDYEIVVQKIVLSGRPGYGRATLQLRYIPPPRY